MQFTITTLTSLLLIGGAIALPEPRRRYSEPIEQKVAVNYLGPSNRPSAEDIYNCYILGTDRYPYLKEEVNCACNCGGTECVGPNVGQISIDLKFDRILPDACMNAFDKMRYGTSPTGDKLTISDVFDDEGPTEQDSYAVSDNTQHIPADSSEYSGLVKK